MVTKSKWTTDMEIFVSSGLAKPIVRTISRKLGLKLADGEL